MDDRPPPHRLGLGSAIGVIIASMIGAGLYTTSGFALADLGTPGRVMLAWAIGGAIALCGAVAYGELARRMPESGGEYLFLSRTIHPAAGVVAGVVSMTAGFTGAIAFAARALEAHVGTAALPDGTLAAITIAAAGLLHLVGLAAGSWVQNAVIAAKLTLLYLLMLQIAQTTSTPLAIPTHDDPWAYRMHDRPLTVGMVAASLVWISLSYAGFNAAVYLADEVRDPERTVPRALLAGTAVVTVVYLWVNAVSLTQLPHGSIAGKPDAVLAAARGFGSYFDDGGLVATLRVAIALSLVTSVSAMIQTGPRVYAKMAADGVLPRWFADESGRIPRRAIAAQTLAAIPAAYLSRVQDFLWYLGLTLSLSSAMAVCGLFRDRSRRLGVVTATAAGLYAAATLGLALVAGISQPNRGAATLVTLLAGGLLYVIMRRHSRVTGDATA